MTRATQTATMPDDGAVLLCPGPVMLSPSVKEALARCEIGHRDSVFSDLLLRLRSNCRQIFRSGDEHSIVFIGGPATSAIESVCASLIAPDATVIVPVNGTFGGRILEILRAQRIPSTPVDFGFGQPFELRRIETIALAQRSHGPVVLAMAHHETSAGLINPVSAVGELARRLDLTLIVDATSSAGVEDLDVTRDGIDACITTSGKCLHGPPGLSIVCARRDLLEATRGMTARTFSLDLHRFHRQMELNGQTPFTAPVPLVVALDRAVTELLAGGVEGRHRVYSRRRAILAAGMKRLGLPLLAVPAGAESASILTVGVPPELGFDALYAAMKQRGYLIYGCKAPLAPRYFQVAVMGELLDDNLAGFLEALESAMTAAGRCQAATA
jgi:2-aminoethylphosphonate-pyruvate transaminase